MGLHDFIANLIVICANLNKGSAGASLRRTSVLKPLIYTPQVRTEDGAALPL